MPYDLMLLGDPGTAREEVLAALGEAEDIRPDPDLDTRFWLNTPHGDAQINIGSKDPVESVHLEFGLESPPLMEAVTLRALDLSERLDMRLEDMQWGHEVHRDSLTRLAAHWQEVALRPAIPPKPARKPWWQVW